MFGHTTRDSLGLPFEDHLRQIDHRVRPGDLYDSIEDMLDDHSLQVLRLTDTARRGQARITLLLFFDKCEHRFNSSTMKVTLSRSMAERFGLGRKIFTVIEYFGALR
jgi:hypothetical protein